MNYIELINQFWRLNEEHSFTTNEVALYFYLLDTANKLGWKNPFTQSNGYIISALTISEPTLIRVRNSLKTFGLLDFKSEKGRRSKTQYELKYLNDLSISVGIPGNRKHKTLNNLSIPVGNSVSICDSIYVSDSPPKGQCLQGSQDVLNKTKHKQNKTIERDGAPTSSNSIISPPDKDPRPTHATTPSGSGPAFEDVWRFFSGAGGTREMAQKFWNKYDGLGWEINGSKIKNWTRFANNFIDNYQKNELKDDREKRKQSAQPSGFVIPPGDRNYEPL